MQVRNAFYNSALIITIYYLVSAESFEIVNTYLVVSPIVVCSHFIFGGGTNGMI